MSRKTITLDVREDIRERREPLEKILSAARTLEPGQELKLIAPFEPVPLFHMMAKQGFQYTARETALGTWEVLFCREGSTLPEALDRAATRLETRSSPGPILAEVVEVDARGLEPPQPLVKILETVATLPAGAEVLARTDRRPLHLFPQLEDRGFAAETKEQSDGTFLTQIRRR